MLKLQSGNTAQTNTKTKWRRFSQSSLPPPQALLIESSNRCGRKFRDAQAVLTLAGKARKRLLNNAVKMARRSVETTITMDRHIRRKCMKYTLYFNNVKPKLFHRTYITSPIIYTNTCWPTKIIACAKSDE